MKIGILPVKTQPKRTRRGFHGSRKLWAESLARDAPCNFVRSRYVRLFGLTERIAEHSIYQMDERPTKPSPHRLANTSQSRSFLVQIGMTKKRASFDKIALGTFPMSREKIVSITKKLAQATS
jgi:hypothetical protein